MAKKHSGASIDIHGGGLDLIFPHHENERAQSEGATHQQFAGTWLHNGMLRFADQKMSKSVGNVERLDDAITEWGAETLLLLFARAHYRSPMDYTPDTLDQAKAAATGFREAFRALRGAAGDGSGDHDLLDEADARVRAFDAAMDDDLATPKALAELFGLITSVNRAVSAGSLSQRGAAAVAEVFRSRLDVLGLGRARQRHGSPARGGRAGRGAPGRPRGPRFRSRRRAAREDRGPRVRRARRWRPVRARTGREVAMAATIYGRNPVREALRGRRRVRRVLATERAASGADWLRGAPVTIVGAGEVAALAGSEDHQGFAAEVDPYPYADADGLAARERPLLVALDEITDPHNLGAIARSALCAGADGLILPRHRSASVTAAVCRASAGAVEHLAIAAVPNLADWLVRSRRAGLWSYAADADAGDRHVDADLADGTILVIGSEGRGVRPRVRAACDGAVRIPIQGAVGSLNASVAAAVLLFEARRQRGF